MLTRLVASVRERATRRVYTRLAQAAGPELRARLEKLLLVPEGQRRSELDLLRRPPFTPTITGLVRALDRLERVRGLGAGDLDLSGIPPGWIVALARYADQAWVTQLADLGPERRIATLTAYTHVLASSARDDVIDIFDVVFGDMQRAATHRGQKRRAGELRDYDAAVAAVHALMRCLLDTLDDDPALAGVLEQFRTDRAGIEQNMGTVQALMRPPADPFHERLVAAYPQISRFLPRLIEALELEAIDSARPVLDAYHALGEWLAGKPRTTRRPDTEVPPGGGHAVVAAARARPGRRHHRPGRLRLLRARPAPRPLAPPRHLRPAQHPVGRSPRRAAHPANLDRPARHLL